MKLELNKVPVGKLFLVCGRLYIFYRDGNSHVIPIDIVSGEHHYFRSSERVAEVIDEASLDILGRLPLSFIETPALIRDGNEYYLLFGRSNSDKYRLILMGGEDQEDTGRIVEVENREVWITELNIRG